MNIAFFISDHGFGHIMRNLPVIKELMSRGHKLVVVSGEKHIEIAKEYLGDGVFIPYHTDAGIIVTPGTLLLDKAKTEAEVDKYLAEFPDRISFAKRIFSDYHIDRAVIDIAPWAILAAKEVSISSYLMASFTWMEQYAGYVDDDKLAVLRNAFISADHVLYYELANEPTRGLLGAGADVGFVAREFHRDEVERIRGEHRQPIVFLSLGGSNSGLDFVIDVSALPYDFITTGALKLVGDNVTYLDISVPNSQDYVKAADYCIAKAGWSTVSEMMLAGVRFGVLTRPDVPEDTMIIEELEHRHAAVAIAVDELKNMGLVLQKIAGYKRVKKTYENGYKTVVDIITQMGCETNGLYGRIPEMALGRCL